MLFRIELERKRKNETLFFFDIDDRLKGSEGILVRELQVVNSTPVNS